MNLYLNNEVKVVHILPQNSNFSEDFINHAKSLNQKTFLTSFNNQRISINSIYKIIIIYKIHRNKLFIFHKVSHINILIIKMFCPRMRFALLYWGDDFYSTFFYPNHLENHAFKRNNYLNKIHYQNKKITFFDDLKTYIKRKIGFKVIEKSAGILSLTKKQFRILKKFYYSFNSFHLSIPHKMMVGYNFKDKISTSEMTKKILLNDSLNILICHSASSSLAHFQTLELLQKYKKKWGTKINLYGFISYSGGSRAYRDELEFNLRKKAQFADQIFFERDFLELDKVIDVLRKVHICIFSSIRDEGVTLLKDFYDMGGVISLNKNSINYDFFKSLEKKKVLTHEEFIQMNFQDIKDLRMLNPNLNYDLLNYEDLNFLEFKHDKIDI